MACQIRELLLADGASPYADWFNSLPADAAAKVTTAKLRMQQGNLSSVEWFRGIGEYKIDFGPGWRIYLAKDGLEIIVLLGRGSKKSSRKTSTKPSSFGKGTSGAGLKSRNKQ